MVPLRLYQDRVISTNNLFTGVPARIFGELTDDQYDFVFGNEARRKLKESVCYPAATEISPGRFDACLTELYINAILIVNVLKEEVAFNFYAVADENDFGVMVTY